MPPAYAGHDKLSDAQTPSSGVGSNGRNVSGATVFYSRPEGSAAGRKEQEWVRNGLIIRVLDRLEREG